MASNRRRRPRRRKDAPKAPKPTEESRNNDEEPPVGGATASTTTTTVHDVPDDVLELVLLRLVSSVCLVRAASACKRWCRVVADAGFLARFRLLRVPRILGPYLNCGDTPVFVPLPAPGILVS